LGLIGFCGIVKNKEWDREPHKIDHHKKRRKEKIRHQSYRYSARAENDAQNPPDDRVIFIEWLEKMIDGHLKRERVVRGRDGRHKIPRYCARAVNVPMMEKIKNPVKKSLHQIDNGEIHTLIISPKRQSAKSQNQNPLEQ
jgi:hypothetical protein